MSKRLKARGSVRSRLEPPKTPCDPLFGSPQNLVSRPSTPTSPLVAAGCGVPGPAPSPSPLPSQFPNPVLAAPTGNESLLWELPRNSTASIL